MTMFPSLNAALWPSGKVKRSEQVTKAMLRFTSAVGCFDDHHDNIQSVMFPIKLSSSSCGLFIVSFVFYLFDQQISRPVNRKMLQLAQLLNSILVFRQVLKTEQRTNILTGVSV